MISQSFVDLQPKMKKDHKERFGKDLKMKLHDQDFLNYRYLILLKHLQTFSYFKQAILRQKLMMLIKLLLFALVLVVCLSADGRFQSDQYARLKQNCSVRCQTKGYFQDICTKVCMSPQCYKRVYQSDQNQSKVSLQLGMNDPDERLFRRCWLDRLQASQNKA